MFGLATAALVAGRVVWMIDDWSRDWTTNDARLAIGNPDPRLHPIEISGEVEHVVSMIESWVGRQPTWQIVSDSAGDPRRLHLTRRTSLFRFVDDIHVAITLLESDSAGSPRCRVDAESQSRVGKGDLGQNPRNLIELRKGILASEPA